MKRASITAVVLLVLLSGFSVQQLHAQYPGQLMLGIRAGGVFGLSNPGNFGEVIQPAIRGALSSSHGPLEGTFENLDAAIYGNYSITELISVQIELSMRTQGYVLRFFTGTEQLRTVDVKYSSFDLPLLARFNFQAPMMNFGFLLGPVISFPLGELSVTETTKRAPAQNDPLYYSSFVINSAVTIGVAAGTFATFPIGDGRIGAHLRVLYDALPLQVQNGEEMEGAGSRMNLSFGFFYERLF